VMIGGPFNSGLLADPRPGATFNYTAAPPELVARARELQAVCARHGVPLTAAALQFPLAHPAVASVLTGPRSVVELKENVASFTTEIPVDLWQELRDQGLVPAHVPLPGIDESSR
jgi:D-threo-aldose 1-dehydrogenase